MSKTKKLYVRQLNILVDKKQKRLGMLFMREIQQRNELPECPDSLISLDRYSFLRTEFDLYRYSKLASVVRLRSAGLPTLPGFVLKELNNETLNYLESWNLYGGGTRLSLRFDSPNPEDHKKLLGSNPTLGELYNMQDLFKSPVIGIVLAENDRFNQNHSVLTSFYNDHLRSEIVGSGFDASDITRGNVSPHEVYEFYRRGEDRYGDDLDALDLRFHKTIGGQEYESSRNYRYGVICSILKKGLGRSVDVGNISRGERIEVEQFLEKRGAEVPQTYQPLGYRNTNELYRYLNRLDTFRSYYRDNFGIELNNKVISASFLKKYGLVFWDVYGGEKYTPK